MTEQDSLLPTDIEERLLARAQYLAETEPIEEIICNVYSDTHPEEY